MTDPFAHLKDMDVEAVTAAFEADEGEPIPGLREALAGVKADPMAGRVTKPGQMLTRAARTALGMSQDDFARLINTPVKTLHGWEHGRFEPPGAVLQLFHLLRRHPEMAAEMRQAA